METEIVIVLISAVVSVGSAVLAYFFTRKNNRDLESFKKELATQKAEKDAQRDYEYEARKRLYSECEPLFFLLNELSENARNRIIRLAKASKDGNLPKWLDHNGYFLKSTIYTLIIPLAVYKLLLSRLTTVDLSVDSKVWKRYQLIKGVLRTFTHDFEFASLNPTLDYDPVDGFTAIESPLFRKQGVLAGYLDNAIESLIVRSEERCISFGEFEKKFDSIEQPEQIYGNENKSLREDFKVISILFTRFHPKKRPVLWRILVTQAYLYLAFSKACIRIEKGKEKECSPTDFISEALNFEDERKDLDWRSLEDLSSYAETWEQPFNITKLWIKNYLSKFSEN